MRLIYLAVVLVIGGAATMLVSYHSGGPAVITDGGTIIALLGFVIYVVGRIRHRKMREQGPREDSLRNENKP